MNAVELREAVSQFLGLEALLLDEGRFEEWLDTLDDDIVYEVPIRQGATTREEEFSGGGYRQRDSKKSLMMRVERMRSNLGYAELPPSRTLRSVSSICILDANENEVSVSSAEVVYRHRANDEIGDTLHIRRYDRLKLTSGGLRLVNRKAVMTEVSMSTPNLGIFV